MLTLALTLLTAAPDEPLLSGCAVWASGFGKAAHQGEARAPAEGVVRAADDGGVTVDHCFVENGAVARVATRATGLRAVAVKVGDVVRPGQPLGIGRHVVVTVDDLPPAAFAIGRHALLVPPTAPVLVIVDVDAHRMTRLEAGRPTHTWEVGHGQAEGPKARRGDLKTPRGQYVVVERSTGPFSGPWADYFGEAWVKLNYPNAFDAARGLDAGLITSAQATAITALARAGAPTPQGTALGGGIGFHGWSAPWDGADGGYGLSWGCVVLHPEEVRAFHDLVPVGTPVVLR